MELTPTQKEVILTQFKDMAMEAVIAYKKGDSPNRIAHELHGSAIERSHLLFSLIESE